MNELVRQTLFHQFKIDPIYFVRGYLSSNWEVLQNIYLKRDDYNDKLTDWSTKVIKANWAFSQAMWKSRCNYIHKTTSNKNQTA